MLLALLIAASAALVVGGPAGIGLLALALWVAAGLGILIQRQIRGLTGDSHGAICEICQLAVLVSAPAIVARW
jgi:cobalamin synthase